MPSLFFYSAISLTSWPSCLGRSVRGRDSSNYGKLEGDRCGCDELQLLPLWQVQWSNAK